jgi:hypothetical protein
MIKIIFALATFAGYLVPGVGNAAPITLLCTGSLSYPDQTPVKINAETAVLDLEAGTFKPPIYPRFKITSLSDTSVSFANDTSTVSLTGSLDRISGSLEFTAMPMSERDKIGKGGSIKMTAWMTAKCVPASRMF